MNITRKVTQTRRARQDRADIIRWTIRRYGTHQAEIYTETIALALIALGNGPEKAGARQRDDLGPDMHTLHVARHGRKGRHAIVFRAVTHDTIEVLRLLHDSMELANHLPEAD